MILVDASVLFDHTRNKDTRLDGWFKQLQVALAGVTRMEALHGARDAKERAKLLVFMSPFSAP